LTTLAACGDVNRNTICNPNPLQSQVHEVVYEWASKISGHLMPRTSAYHEIWLDGKKVSGEPEDSVEDSEPVYGKLYLPRKFKIAIAVPPSNDVDIFAHDLGFIAIIEKEKLLGFNVCVGGGLGMTHSVPETYPQLAKVIGFCKPEEVIDITDAVVKIQRDFGDRTNREHARLKYTIDDRGSDWFNQELRSRLGWDLEEAKPFSFDQTGDRYGWVQGVRGRWHYTLFVENGRVKDSENRLLMTGLREIAKVHKGDLRITPNQNIIIGNVSTKSKPRIEGLLNQYSLQNGHQTKLRLNAMACVALPTCELAMAESERYLPSLISKIEAIMQEYGLSEDAIVIRMSGCPNGCSRPYLAEIAFVGKALNSYNMYLGTSFAGHRLNKLYRENLGEDEILKELRPLIREYAEEREEGEHFGDFVVRKGHVPAVEDGRDFHT
jgi:sulfite reductase (NADPH) hemoprotein beta-component